MGEDIPDAPDLEVVEIEITIHDDVYTHEIELDAKDVTVTNNPLQGGLTDN